MIAKTDADGAGKALGSRFGIQGFPTLKWFAADDATKPEDYQGGRDLDSLAQFVTQKAGVKSSIKPPPPPAATIVDVNNFDEITSDSSKSALIAFTAPWCGHCKTLKPIYEKVAQAFKNEPTCIVGNMNADAAENKDISRRVGVSGFPTIKFFSKDSEEPIAYNGARTEDALIEFLNQHCGTHRAPGGRLLPTAGKVLALDTLASRFFSASSSTDRSSYLDQAQAYLQSNLPESSRATAEYYIKVMQRIGEKGTSWLNKETDRLTKLVSSSTSSPNALAPEKLDQIQQRLNVLSSFVHKTYDEAAEALSDAASDLSDLSADQVEDAVRHATGSVKAAAGQVTDRIKEEL